MHSRAFFSLLAFACLSTSAFAAAVDAAPRADERTFLDAFLLPRRLDALGDKAGYVVAFSALNDRASDDCLALMDVWAPIYAEANLGFLNLDMCVGATNIFDVAREAMQRNAQYPYGLDYRKSLQQAFGVKHPGTVAVCDPCGKPVYVGPCSGVEEAIADLLAGTACEGELSAPVIPAGEGEMPAEVPSYTENLAPLIRDNCLRCHRQGGIAPFSLETYRDVASHGDAVVEAVLDRRMPPWYATGGSVAYSNTPKLSDADRQTFGAWNKHKMEGPKSALPDNTLPEEFAADIRLTASNADQIPAVGFMDYVAAELPYVPDADAWVQGVRIIASNPKVVHHCVLLAFAPDGTTHQLGFSAVGTAPFFLSDGIAFKIPKGSRLVANMHYSTTGKPEQNTMSIEFAFPRKKVEQEFHILVSETTELALPPRATRTEVVSADTMIDRPFSVLMSFVHLHLRGQSARVDLIPPQGDTIHLLELPIWNFGWQLLYSLEPGSLIVPAGTRLRFSATYDNSAYNPYNPDPNNEVLWGRKSIDEMSEGYAMGVYPDEHLNIDLDPEAQKQAFRPIEIAPSSN